MKNFFLYRNVLGVEAPNNQPSKSYETKYEIDLEGVGRTIGSWNRNSIISLWDNKSWEKKSKPKFTINYDFYEMVESLNNGQSIIIESFIIFISSSKWIEVEPKKIKKEYSDDEGWFIDGLKLKWRIKNTSHDYLKKKYKNILIEYSSQSDVHLRKVYLLPRKCN